MNGESQTPGPPSEPDPGDEASAATEFRIVGIGASAGGLQAVSDQLGSLPRDLNMAFVVVMHLDPTHASSLAEILGRACEMPVRQATDGIELEPGHVHVIPPNNSMTVRGCSLHLTPRAESRNPQRPIDLFLSSLAEEHDGRGIGIVLSGTGSDGTAGLQAIKAAGGITFAQDESASHGDMPASAVAAGCVDAVLPPEGIARELIRISRHPSHWLYRESASKAAHQQRVDVRLDGLVKRLSRASGIDFVNYKQTTIRRRIQRRIVLLGLERLDQYIAYFNEHPEEAKTLCQDILIHVTNFFRDPGVFDALHELIFPTVVNNRAPSDPIRFWVPGCSTGEEVYSLAISLQEFLEQRSVTVPIRLFGTDVSEEAVARARTGWYPERITAEVTPQQLSRFFTREGEGYVVAKHIRDLCVFARQDATRDPPFSNVDLISCRNLLIYLGPALQRKVVPTFHYALRDGGFLLLGTAESVGAMDDLFVTVDERRSIYVRKSVPRRLTLDLAAYQPELGGSGAPGRAESVASTFDVQREADRVVLSKYAPVGVVIDEGMNILQFRGDTGAFLTPAPGSPSSHLLPMAREGLLPDLRAVVEEGMATELPVRREGLRIRADGREIRANLELIPIRVPGSAERCYVILFEEAPEGAGEPPSPPSAPAQQAVESSDPDSARIEQLERELVATRDYLRANVDHLEAANEQLRAANEEILSSNEELYSTNEELQTAKEEVQATNEELLTMNEELQHRNQEVVRLGDDLNNVLTSVKIPVVMLGRDLRVRRFTPGAARFFRISKSDIGRGLLELEPKVVVPDLGAMIFEVLDTLTVGEREVQDEEGRWHSLRVLPYRTEDDRVDGVVLSYTDIDVLKRLTDQLESARDFAESVVMSVREPLLVIDSELSIRKGNSAFFDTYRTTPDAIEGRPLGDGVTASWATPALQKRFAEVGKGGAPFSDLAVEAEIPGRGSRRLQLNARAIRGGDDRERLVLLAVEDVTDLELERADKERLSRKVQETQRLESLGVLAGGIAHDFNNILTAVLGFAEIIKAELPPESPSLLHVGKIVESAVRATELCTEMLAYSGRGRFQVKSLHLSTLVRQSAPLLEAMVSKKSILRYDLADELPSVEADLAQIRQVLTNLVINASEALGEQEGHIVITTGTMRADRAYLEDARVSDVPEGHYVYLEVADDGQGMSPEAQARIFDPFFTTKFTGRGLGLAAVLGIVRGHRGALRLASEPGRGSTFRLLLPPSESPGEKMPPQANLDGLSWEGEGTLLVVDDEKNVRSFIRTLLPRHGVQVEEASSGQEGIEKLQALADRIDVVLLDLTMPGLSGRQVFEGMRKLRKDLPIILMSGYDEEEAVRGFLPTDLAGFLRKPFSMEELAASLRHALSVKNAG